MDPSKASSVENKPTSPGNKVFTKENASRLDHVQDNSNIRRSEFRGFANLILISSALYTIYHPVINWYEGQRLFEYELGDAMFRDFIFLVFMWAKLSLWSFTAYGLHILYMRRLISSRMLLVLQHLTQAVSIFYSLGQCLYKNWPIIPAGFVQIMAIIYCMKMHSFTVINKDFADAVGSADAEASYPANISLRNFCYYLCCPVLVYEPHYPQGNGFRIGYFLSKLFLMVGSMMLMYLICSSYIIPTVMKSPSMSFLEAFVRLIFPLLGVNWLVFYIVFECICNLFAEVTNFGDREFYQDWWNSTSWDEFSRKWNRPVHMFLLRHVYLEPQMRYHWSQRDATIATFIFSACMHEMILAVCFRIVRMYLFLMMLLQMPLIVLCGYYKGTTLGNSIFWAGLMIGAPLLAVAYGREWAQMKLADGSAAKLQFF